MAHGKVVMEVNVEYDRELGEEVESYEVCVYAESEAVLDFVDANMNPKYSEFSACYREEHEVDGCWGFDMFFFKDKEVFKAFKAHVNRLIKKA